MTRPCDMREIVLTDIQIPVSLIGNVQDFCGSIHGGLMRGDLVVQGGRVTEMRPSSTKRHMPTLILPKLVDPHCHLDKCHTIDRLSDVGGNLAEAIEAQRADKVHWSDKDVRERALRGLQEYRDAGTGLVRSHVDWGDEAKAPHSWDVLRELSEQSQDITLQLSALTGADAMSEPAFAKKVAASVPSGHALGMFVFNQPGHKMGIRNLFAEAETRSLALDFHVDEGIDPALNGLETIADIALEMRHQGPILCGHAVSLSTRNQTDIRRIADKLAKAGIAVALLPSTNLYLQGRGNGSPTVRGISMAHELRASGVTVVLGNDNVRDAFCPVGRHDPLFALQLGILAAHLDPSFDKWLPCISTDAARVMGKEPVFINGASLKDLIFANAEELSNLICGSALRPAAQLTEVTS